MAMGGRGFGILGNIVVGVIGALLGGFVGSTLFSWDVTGFNVGASGGSVAPRVGHYRRVLPRQPMVTYVLLTSV